MKNKLLKKTAKGFNLIEMLVVIAVIGVIAAIAIPNIGRINETAKAQTAAKNATSKSTEQLTQTELSTILEAWNHAVTIKTVDHTKCPTVESKLTLLAKDATSLGLPVEIATKLEHGTPDSIMTKFVNVEGGKMMLITSASSLMPGTAPAKKDV